MVQQILEFQEKFSDYEAVGSAAYIDRGGVSNRTIRQVKRSDITVSNHGIIVKIDSKMASYIRGKLSPTVRAKEHDQYVDTNRLLLALSLTRVYFAEKEENSYFPLVSVDLTDQKDLIFSAIQTGSYELFIPWQSPIYINDHVMKTFFDISYEENGQDKDEFIADELGDIVFGTARNDIDSTLECLYNPFTKNLNTTLDLAFPQNNSEKSALFMFFNQRKEVRLKREYDMIKENPSELLEEYLLFEQEKDQQPDLDNDIFWPGSLTKEFPLGRGQGLVMQRNQMNDKIIPVIGGPGTGKTTLFLSLIAAEVAKRAINMVMGGDDYNNMILVTSTSNKAIDNVVHSLKAGFKYGFVYVGGSQKNKAESAGPVREYMHVLEGREYSEEKHKYFRDKILKTQKLFTEKRETFNYVKSMNLEFKDYDELDSYVSEFIEVESAINSKVLKQLSIIGVDFDLALKIRGSEDFDFYKEELSDSGLVSSFKGLFKDDINLKAFNRDFSTSFDHKSAVMLLSTLSKLTVSDFEHYKGNQTITKLRELVELFEGKEKFFKGIMKNESYTEYFRTNLFKMNYDFYIACLNFMKYEIIENKEKVLRAVGYLVADNQYQYLIDNYGYKADGHEEFLKYLSMAYPVTTSTLAAVGSAFQTIRSNKVFNTIMADEAGMITSHTMVGVLNRSNRAIIVGDPKQLAPIVNINEIFLSDLRGNVSDAFWQQYTPTNTSAFHRAAGTIEGGYKPTGRGIVLDEHRRCSKKIAELFIYIAEYEGLLVKTITKKTKQLEAINESLWFFDVKNQNQESFMKINFDEINKIEAILNRLEGVGYDLTKDVGIITPYRDQERELTKRFGKRVEHNVNGESKIGTVHKFQGAEFKVVIFSTVVSRDHDTLSFINNDPSMINVSISRAKEIFMVVGDYDKLTREGSYGNYAGRMAERINLKGTLVRAKKNTSIAA